MHTKSIARNCGAPKKMQDCTRAYPRVMTLHSVGIRSSISGLVAMLLCEANTSMTGIATPSMAGALSSSASAATCLSACLIPVRISRSINLTSIRSNKYSSELLSSAATIFGTSSSPANFSSSVDLLESSLAHFSSCSCLSIRLLPPLVAVRT
ncbi:hypothetical protein GQ54DRAFT_159617 [Martensiomyces pterosporus]|nr:hypothetical protein GQ54DRAFT_159617 [Martensiomyces pterosporus]